MFFTNLFWYRPVVTFLMDPPLSDFLSRSQYLHSVMALTASELDLKKNQKRLDASVMALEALRNVIKNNAGIT